MSNTQIKAIVDSLRSLGQEGAGRAGARLARRPATPYRAFEALSATGFPHPTNPHPQTAVGARMTRSESGESTRPQGFSSSLERLGPHPHPDDAHRPPCGRSANLVGRSPEVRGRLEATVLLRSAAPAFPTASSAP